MEQQDPQRVASLPLAPLPEAPLQRQQRMVGGQVLLLPVRQAHRVRRVDAMTGRQRTAATAGLSRGLAGGHLGARRAVQEGVITALMRATTRPGGDLAGAVVLLEGQALCAMAAVGTAAANGGGQSQGR